MSRLLWIEELASRVLSLAEDIDPEQATQQIATALTAISGLRDDAKSGRRQQAVYAGVFQEAEAIRHRDFAYTADLQKVPEKRSGFSRLVRKLRHRLRG